MRKIDLRKQLKPLYSAKPGIPALVEMPRLKCLMIEGQGHPEGNVQFQEAMQALFGLAYTLKFKSKLGPAKLDWTMMPPEGIWWARGDVPLEKADKADWRWALLIVQPDAVTAPMVREAKAALREKSNPPRLDDLRLASIREGKSLQIMHIGPYSTEQDSLVKLHHFAAENGYSIGGRHHEIYFSDPRRAKPEKMKTLLRLPVKRAAPVPRN